jgi:hypothetical protein
MLIDEVQGERKGILSMRVRRSAGQGMGVVDGGGTSKAWH